MTVAGTLDSALVDDGPRTLAQMMGRAAVRAEEEGYLIVGTKRIVLELRGSLCRPEHRPSFWRLASDPPDARARCGVCHPPARDDVVPA